MAVNFMSSDIFSIMFNRQDMLGLNPLTISGFILAGVIIVLNNVLGAGWATDLLSKHSVTDSAPQTVTTVAPQKNQIFDLDDIDSLDTHYTRERNYMRDK
jgi:hypothetical protein